MDGWTRPVDIYCERLGPGFWAEPLNAASNAAFLVAALAALALWRRDGGRDGPALALIVLIATIGTGSFLFHTFANAWSALADVLPIALFIYGFFFLAMRRLVGLGAVGAGLATLGFLAFSIAFPRAFPPGFLNGSVSYLPALIGLVGVGGLLRLKAAHGTRFLANPKNRTWGAAGEGQAQRRRVEASRAAGGLLVAAGGVFAVSLAFRSLDMAVCEALPVGVHYFWHLLNATVLFLAVEAARRGRVEA